jgi:hypothetical protein
MSIEVSKSMKLQSLPFHPFLAVSFQILTIYAININQANISAVMFVLLIAFILTALVFILFSFITKDIKQAAIVVTYYCFLFFTYGRLFDIAPGLSIPGLVIGRNKYLLPLYVLLVIAGTLWIVRSEWCKTYLKRVTYFLNMFSVGLVLVAALVAIANFDWITFGSKKHLESKHFSIKTKAHQVSQSRKMILQPNVYFIILDSYASHRVLKKYYEWDDSGVVAALRSRGFSVNENARSNYPFTVLSVGATLNMRYIHEDREFIDAKSKSDYLVQHIRQNEVMERFKSEGYDVISNEFGVFRLLNKKHSAYKDKESLLSNEFVDLVIHVSLLRIIEQELSADAKRQDILANLEDLKLFDIPNKPIFVYSHILCPHPPYIFHADGSKPTLFESTFGRVENKKGYINQVRFIGSQIIEVVDSLRRRDSSAVIIVQADHGHGYIIGDYPLDRKRPPLEFIDAQYGILSAIYLPPGIMIPEKSAPVNLFRYLFNALFDAKLEVLPDRSFFTAIKEPYAFYEVTNDIERLIAEK